MIIATTTANFTYFTGVKLETYERFKAVIKCGDYIAVVIPAVDAGRVKSGEVFLYKDGEDPAEILKKAAAGCQNAEVVYIDGGTTLRHFEIIKRALGAVDYRIADDLLYTLRAVKREEEVVYIREAARRIREVVDLIELQQGRSEADLALEIKRVLVERGLEPGPVLVQFGVNTAYPHQGPTGKKLQFGEAVVLDVSASYRGYYGDLTFSFFYGEEPPLYREIYDAVKEAQERAIAAIRPGVYASEVDSAARSFISQRGYGQFFIHRTGHGLGLEIHEPPDVSPNSPHVLMPGMVFTIEPGIYIPDKYGVRLEVDVYLSHSGVHIL